MSVWRVTDIGERSATRWACSALALAPSTIWFTADYDAQAPPPVDTTLISITVSVLVLSELICDTEPPVPLPLAHYFGALSTACSFASSSCDSDVLSTLPPV